MPFDRCGSKRPGPLMPEDWQNASRRTHSCNPLAVYLLPVMKTLITSPHPYKICRPLLLRNWLLWKDWSMLIMYVAALRPQQAVQSIKLKGTVVIGPEALPVFPISDKQVRP